MGKCAYKNGALLKTATGVNPPLKTRSRSYIGRSNWNDRYMDGKVDEFRLYSTHLTVDDVNAIYGAGNGETPIAPPSITSAGTANATVGTAFTYVITTNAENPTFGAFNLPPGLSLSGAVISGTPSAGGTYTSTLTASTAAATGSKVLTITIPASPALVKALPATEVLASTVRVNGEVDSTGGDNPAVTLFYGATDANEDVNGWNLNQDLGTKGKEVFNVDLNNLLLNKQYFYRFRSVNSAGTSWSLAQSFTTLAQPSNRPSGMTLRRPTSPTAMSVSTVPCSPQVEPTPKFSSTGGSMVSRQDRFRLGTFRFPWHSRPWLLQLGSRPRLYPAQRLCRTGRSPQFCRQRLV